MKKKLFKVLQITQSLHVGGAEKFAIQLSNEFAQYEGFKVYLLVIQKIESGDILLEQIDNKVQVIEIDKVRSQVLTPMLKIALILRKIKPDIVHTHIRGLTYSSIGLMLYRIPTIHTIHSLAEKEVGKRLRRIHRFLFKNFNVSPVSISQEVLKGVKREYGEKMDFMVVNGVCRPKITDDLEKVTVKIKSIKKNSETKVVLNIASVTDIKNQLMLIELFNELNIEKENVVLLIIGGSTGRNLSYLKRCKELALDNEKIHFIGQISNVGDYLSNCDAICLASRYEGLPLVILEAMSFGIPVISTPAGGVPEVVKRGLNGYISTGFDKASLKKEILCFINEKSPFDKEKIVDIYSKKYSISKTAQDYKKYYDMIIKSN